MKRPRVIANFAVTADGKVSTRNHTPTGFTSPADKRRLQEVRALGDAVLVGAGTVAADTMDLRLKPRDLREAREKRGQAPEPLRVVVTHRGRLDAGLRIFRPGGAPLLVFSSRQMPVPTRSFVAPRADLWLFGNRSVELPAVLAILRRDYGVRTVVCEGGPTLFGALLRLGAVDELRLTWAGVVFGGAAAPTLTGLPGPFLPETVRARLTAWEPGDGEVYLTYRISRGRQGIR